MPSDREPAVFTLQERGLGATLPDPMRYEPGYAIGVDYKQQGRVVRSERFICERYFYDGEEFRFWRRAALEAAERVRDHRGQPSSSTAIEPPGRSSQPE